MCIVFNLGEKMRKYQGQNVDSNWNSLTSLPNGGILVPFCIPKSNAKSSKVGLTPYCHRILLGSLAP